MAGATIRSREQRRLLPVEKILALLRPVNPNPGLPGSLLPAVRLPANVALLDEVIDQLAGGVVHLDVEGLHAIGEVVEEPHRRDGHKEAERRGDQGFRNTAGDSADTGGLLGSDFLEGLEDAGDGSEEADEGGR